MEAELRKIVNDGYTKFKIYENGKEALNALDSLKQANSDLTKTVNELSKKRDDLLAEASKIDLKIKAADETAAQKIKDAEAKAQNILDAALSAVKEQQATAESKLKAIEEKIASKQAIEVNAGMKSETALKKLNEINAELEKATTRFKNLVGA